MDTLPVELTSHILQFACTDNGQTARRLSLVSSHFRLVAQPYRYQSIAVSGHTQISALAQILALTPTHARRTRDVCITDTSPTPAAAALVAPHLTRLLALLAPTIETLSLSCGSPRTSTVLIAFLFGLHHPRLAELSVRGYYPFPALPRAMPALSHLHLTGNRNPHGLLMAGGLEAAFPGLTHLRVSGLLGARTFAGEVVEAVEGAESADAIRDGEGAMFVAKLPASVRRVFIQPQPTPTAMPGVVVVSANPKPTAHEYMLEALHTLAATHAHPGGIQVTLVKADDASAASAEAEWRDRLDGGDGCWAVSNSL